MSKKRRAPKAAPAKPAPPKPSRPSAIWLGGIAALAIGVMIFVSLSRPAPNMRDFPREIPNPDTKGMDTQVAERIQSVRQAVLADPDSGRTWGRLGMVFDAHHLAKDALRSYAKAAELAPDEFRWPYLLARSLKNSDLVSALEQASNAVELNPDYAPAHVLRAELLEQENDLQAAREHYQKAIAFDPRCAVAELGLGRLYLTEEDLDKSLEHLERAAALQSAGPIHAFLAMVHTQRGDIEAAERAAQLAATLPQEIALRDPVMDRVMEEGVSPIGYQRRAAMAEAAGDQAAAESLYRDLLKARRRDADAHYNLANLLSRQGRIAEAANGYRQVLEIDPGSTSARFNLGNVLAARGDLDDAIAQYRKVLVDWPDHSEALTNLGNALARQGQLAEASRQFRRAIQANPNDSIAHHHLGQILAGEGKLPEAVAHFRSALAAKPETGPVHLNLAVALARLGDFSAAARHLREAQRLGVQPPRELLALLREAMPEPGQS